MAPVFFAKRIEGMEEYMAESVRRRRRVSDESVVEVIIQLCAAAYPDNQVRPEDIAMMLYPEDWQSILKRIRLTARQLAEMGHIDILRKGKRVDPDDFKGVYRLSINEAFFDLPFDVTHSE